MEEQGGGGHCPGFQKKFLVPTVNPGEPLRPGFCRGGLQPVTEGLAEHPHKTLSCTRGYRVITGVLDHVYRRVLPIR